MITVYEQSPGHYVAYFDDGEVRETGAHCLACAKVDIMMETGLPVDIRGWNKQGFCGTFLKASRVSIDEEYEEVGKELRRLQRANPEDEFRVRYCEEAGGLVVQVKQTWGEGKGEWLCLHDNENV